MDLKDVWSMLKQTVTEWLEDGAPQEAAALSYYMIFSLPPLLIIVIAVAGLVFDQQTVQQEVVGQIEGLVGEQGANIVVTMIEGAQDTASGLIATLISIGVLLFSATGVFVQLERALNAMWEVPPEAQGGILETVRDRFLSFTMILGIGFLLLVSLVVSAALSGLEGVVGQYLPFSATLLQIFNFVISLGVITLLFAMIFKILPDVEIAWGDVWVGALVTALLFTLGKFLIGLYLGQSTVASTYGAAGSLVVILLWVYYSTQILLLGAEFTQVYARRYGSRILPEGVEIEAGKEGVEEREPAPPPTGRELVPEAKHRGREPAMPRQATTVVAAETPTLEDWWTKRTRGVEYLLGVASFAVGVLVGAIYRSRK
jgi:membrane protein